MTVLVKKLVRIITTQIFIMRAIILPLVCVIILTNQSVTSLSENSARSNSYFDETRRISLSGFSAGGTFAQMLQFSYPDLFDGIGVFSHNYYRCGPITGNVDDYDRACTTLVNNTKADFYNPLLVHQDIKKYLNKGLIGDPKLLNGKKLYVYTGLRSSFFALDQSLGILQVYQRYIQNPDDIRTRVLDSPHVLPTNNNYGPSCDQEIGLDSFYIGNCKISGPYEALNFIWGNRVNRKPTGKNSIGSETLMQFDQSKFFQDFPAPQHQMDNIGYYYVPKRCNRYKNKCMIHFYFHGCRTGREFAETNHIANSGFLEIADLNGIIMVFPQTHSTPNGSKSGCWDTFGVSGPLYATREGTQLKVVKRMIDTFLAL